MALIRRLRWRLFGSQMCGCGEHRLGHGTAMELAGVRHRTDGPCYHCDTYGQPVSV